MSPRFRSRLWTSRPPRRPVVTVPQVVLASLSPRRTRPALGPLPQRDLDLLRCHDLDSALLVTVLGRAWPADLLATPHGRARALEPFVPLGSVVAGRAALWLHTGYGPPPSRMRICTMLRTSAGPLVDVSRAEIERSDQCRVDRVHTCTLARAAVDVARLARPREAVETLMVALRHGETRMSLFLALMHCRGGGGIGRPRAAALIDVVTGVTFPVPGAGAGTGVRTVPGSAFENPGARSSQPRLAS